MNFDLTPEQLELRDSVREFASGLDDHLETRAASGIFSRRLWEVCADFGVQSMPIPEPMGAGLDVLSTVVAMEALGYGCRDLGLLFSIHAHMWSVVAPIVEFGTDSQRAEWLPALTDGTWVGAHGMSEPGSGSDAFSLRTRAVPDGDGWILNGTKMFVTNAPVADFFMVFATLDPGKGMWGLTCFGLPRDTEGLRVSAPIAKMGLTTSPMGEVILEDCRVGPENLIGRPGQGATIFNHSMRWERSLILASTIGALERELEQSLNYVQEREQFGRPIGQFQLVASRIAEMKLRFEVARLLQYRAAWYFDEGRDNATEAALAKLYISEAAVHSGLDAIRVRGGYGYMAEYRVERDLRDFIGGTLYSGTTDIQRLLVARGLGLNSL